ncbi:NAD(P)/FAD-dependent oxidoreductase [Prosthecobacter sp.]|uniref:phytoene desaturase family protein n=1 Tax=Prosthecobacter sp. TaxID=1965333 RepID=UPI001E030E38|nr:NAD(P)/FAD-dependent oxidoreductase [Prosthecobacter sp.]MCB1276799.1 NAD(P)/FAD-dependent oxidoreductase [Prosthecobacter sp.]
MTYDGIILGSGHNALVLACYAARAGLKVAVVEQNDVAGGGLATEEVPLGSGFKHNTHSFFHRGITAMPWYRELQVERYGVRYLEPELNVAMILPENRVLEWWTDFEKTFASFAAISPRDADRLREWTERFRPIVEQILIPEAQNAPLPPEERLAALKQTEHGRTLLEVQALSPIEFVMREFEHPAVRAGLLFFNGLREVDLRQKGFGHSIPALLASPRKAQMCVGGSRRLAEALCMDLREHGGVVFTRWQPRSILMRQGCVCGVESVNGDRIEATQFVASGLNPQQTFIDLIPADVAPSHLRERAAGFEYNLLAPLFALNLNLREPPRYAAAEQHPELNEAFMMILGLDDVAQFHDIVAAHERGEIPRTVMWGACPTQFDITQGVAGHTAFMWEKLPYALKGDARNWDAKKDEHGRAMLELWQTYAPNLREAVLGSFTRSALDTERLLPNMRRGDLLVGSFANDQVGYHRPFKGAGAYRTEIPGLYLCGGSTHPGGNVTGLCGYNAAKVVLADYGLGQI